MRLDNLSGSACFALRLNAPPAKTPGPPEARKRPEGWKRTRHSGRVFPRGDGAAGFYDEGICPIDILTTIRQSVSIDGVTPGICNAGNKVLICVEASDVVATKKVVG